MSFGIQMPKSALFLGLDRFLFKAKHTKVVLYHIFRKATVSV